jgi:methionyl-tRNA formyltransferase
MKVVFFGTSVFAVPALRAVAEHVALVVTQPDRPSGRGNRVQYTPVKEAALELGLPVEAPEKSRAPEFVDQLRALDADLFLVAAYGQILSQKLLDSSKRGGINLHGSILPEYRGAAPIQRCILDGRTETGVTLMQMDKGMDTGDIIQIDRLTIGSDETYGELQDRLALLGAEMAQEWLPRLVAGDYPRTPQNSEQATHAAKVEKAEAELQFDRYAQAEYNRYRAFQPSPGPFISLGAVKARLSQVRMGEGEGEPGTIIRTSPELTVAFANGALEFRELQPEGKKRVSGRDFANGARLRPGDRFLS